jgi:hypothetical protein
MLLRWSARARSPSLSEAQPQQQPNDVTSKLSLGAISTCFFLIQVSVIT